MVKIFSDSQDKKSLGYTFRQKRFVFFKNIIQPLIEKKQKAKTLPIRILDVGGLQSYWINMGFQEDEMFHITLVNLVAEQTSFSNIVGISGDATNLSKFKDDEFDIVFSNSVIEHLYNYSNQQKMSEEVIRVGRYHFIQTPNRHFIIEPHYLLPFFQYLPKKLKYQILVKTRLSRGIKWGKDNAGQYIKEIRLITINEMKRLFPQSIIYKEKFCGLTKSFTAHNFKN